jgi:hypothetical protein
MLLLDDFIHGMKQEYDQNKDIEEKPALTIDLPSSINTFYRSSQ